MINQKDFLIDYAAPETNLHIKKLLESSGYNFLSNDLFDLNKPIFETKNISYFIEYGFVVYKLEINTSCFLESKEISFRIAETSYEYHYPTFNNEQFIIYLKEPKHNFYCVSPDTILDIINDYLNTNEIYYTQILEVNIRIISQTIHKQTVLPKYLIDANKELKESEGDFKLKDTYIIKNEKYIRVL